MVLFRQHECGKSHELRGKTKIRDIRFIRGYSRYKTVALLFIQNSGVVESVLSERNRLKTTLSSKTSLRRLAVVHAGGLRTPASNSIRWQS